MIHIEGFQKSLINNAQELDLRLNECVVIQDQISKFHIQPIMDNLEKNLIAIQKNEAEAINKKDIQKLLDRYSEKIKNISSEMKSLEDENHTLESKIQSLHSQSDFSLIYLVGSIIFVLIGLILVVTGNQFGLIFLIIPIARTQSDKILDTGLKIIVPNGIEIKQIEERKAEILKLIENMNDDLEEIQIKKNSISLANDVRKELDTFEITDKEVVLNRLNQCKVFLQIREEVKRLKSRLMEIKNYYILKNKKTAIIEKINQLEISIAKIWEIKVKPIQNDIELLIQEMLQKLESNKKHIVNKRDDLEDLSQSLIAVTKEMGNISDLSVQLEKLAKQRINLDEKKETVKKLQNELKNLHINLKKKLAKYSSSLTSIKRSFETSLQLINIPIDSVPKDRNEFIKLISNTLFSSSIELKEKSELLLAGDIYRDEIRVIKSILDQYSLLQKELDKETVNISRTQILIDDLTQKVRNAEHLENAWSEVNNQVKSKIESFSSSIITELQDTFSDNFELLGGHEDFSYNKLDIRYLRGRINVTIDIGNSKKEKGTPKALLSNGQQVSLIHALFLIIIPN